MNHSFITDFADFDWSVFDLDESPWPKSNNQPDSNLLKIKRKKIILI